MRRALVVLALIVVALNGRGWPQMATSTMLSLATSATSISPGTPVTLTASITNATTPAPTGRVSFLYGATVLGSAPLATGASGTAAAFTASTAGIPPGTYSIKSSYAGDSNYGPATSNSVSIKVLPPASSTALTPGSQTVLQGNTASLTVTVTGANASPTGKVSLYDGPTLLATATLSNIGGAMASTFFNESTASVPAGTYSVHASYGGDSANQPSVSSAVSVTVEAGTPVTLMISPNPVPAGDNFTLTATVKGKDSPGGTMYFLEGPSTLATVTFSGGVAQVTEAAGTLPPGTYQMKAQYSGDANNAAGVSPVVSLTVQ